jgi:hypothetical protein
LLLSRSSIATATASAATASAATASAAIAAVATAGAAMAVMPMMATTTAATTTIAAAAAVAAAATMTKGHRLVITAQQSDADDREENRETKHNNSIHPQILQITYRYLVSETTELAVTTITSRLPTAQCRNATETSRSPHLSHPDLVPCCQILWVTKDITIAKARS